MVLFLACGEAKWMRILNFLCAVFACEIFGSGWQSALHADRDSDFLLIRTFSQVAVWPEQAVITTVGVDGWSRVIISYRRQGSVKSGEGIKRPGVVVQPLRVG